MHFRIIKERSMKSIFNPKKSIMDRSYGWYFSAPAMILYLILFIWPAILSIYLGMTDWSVAKWDYDFVGLANFTKIFASEKYMKYVGRTLWFAFITSVLKTVIGLLLALALNKKLKTKNVLRAVYFVPVVISPLIIGIIFNSIFHPTGILNGFLALFGIEGPHWLTDKSLALWTVISVEVWRFMGLNMAIFLSGLQMIDKVYYEAADIDGASSWQKFTAITLPCLMPSITTNVVLNIMNGLRVFDVVFTLTKGGPGDLTEVINTVVFREYSQGKYALSTALGVILFALTAIIAFGIYIPMSKKGGVEND